MRAHKIQQKIARLALGEFQRRLTTRGEPDPYETGENRDILGEDDYGTYFAPRHGDRSWWEPFNFRKPGHMAAWRETRRSGRVAFLDLEPHDSGRAE